MPDSPATPATSDRHRLLVVEDDPSIRMLLESALGLSGYDVASAATGREALRDIESLRPDLVLLDVMLPDLDGLAVTRSLRAAGVLTPVLFLTARGEVSDRIAGLTAGGDDYVSKPFDLEEVLLRIRAILRRTDVERQEEADDAGDGILRFADLELDTNAYEVHRGGEEIPLSPTEFNLLTYLMENANRVLSKPKILNHVWGYDHRSDGTIVETYIRYLRRKIDRVEPRLLHTVRGVGYCLRLPRDRTAKADR
ncbi:response regulator transcription factor [Streptomyces sp. NPDC056390]|uniref:response regulator transcription factor n=1 Tax=Streptomyces sp. NPDC056390 TaxID=3345806 RepID=UPI0035E17045